LADRREFPARVIVTDPRSDLAVLQIDTGGERLAALDFADTRNALVGDQVLAIGNPFGVGQTVTSGIISALARTDIGITDFSFFIQTDAAINPGNSGGALVDMDGALVGVNTAIFSRDGGSAGVGFSVPAEMVKRVVESALAEGRIVRPWTGARAQTVDAEIARTMNLSRPGGVVLTELFAGGPAERAGLRRGDVILSLGGADVADEQGLRYLAATRRPGERVAVVYMRGGQRGEAQMTLQPPPETPAREERTIAARSSFQGARVATLNPAAADEAGLDPFTRGVLVLAVAADSPAAREGLRPGDLILEMGGEPVSSAAALESRLRGDGRRGQVILQRGERRLTATLFL
jgi:S1-C subfamily serine protease